MSAETENPLLFKISILGDEGIGKDKFIKLFTSDQFQKETDSESGVNSYKGDISIDTEKGKLECIIWIWDLKGKELSKRIYSNYLKETNGAILFFDLTNRKSFNRLSNWIDNIRNNTESEIPILLVGNKESSQEFVVSPSEISSIIRKFNLYYIETSLTTKEGIFDSFYCITSLTMGVEVNHELFLSKDIVYYPTSSSLVTNPSSSLLTSQDLSKLSQKAIFEKIEILEEKIKKSMEIEVPRNIILTEIALSIIALILFIIADFLYQLEKTNPLRKSLTDTLLWIAVGSQIIFTVLIIVSSIKLHQL